MVENEDIPTEEQINSVVEQFVVSTHELDHPNLVEAMVESGERILEEIKTYRVTIVNTIVGDYDLQLAAYFYYIMFYNKPQTYTDLYSVSEKVIEFKKRLRDELLVMWLPQSQDDNQSTILQIYQHMQRRNQPHVMGTIDEIAERTGLSKKKVRRLKRDGELEEYLQQQNL